jgi:hypothetical protein
LLEGCNALRSSLRPESDGSSRIVECDYPSELNAVARPVLIAKRCGPQFLNYADSLDNMIRAGCFAETDGEIFDFVRCIIETSADSESRSVREH